MSQQTLNSQKVIETIQTLSNRILERFPDSGLGRVCGQLLTIAGQAKQRSAGFARPIVSLRILTVLIVVGTVAGTVAAVVFLKPPSGNELTLGPFVELLEAAINDVVLIGIAVFFLITLERRVKRRRALAAMHELRVVAHIVDMHQLTKDPDRVIHGGKETASSPKRTMTEFELSRYFDYSSEMLSLTGKIAAIYVQNFDDDAVLAAANEIETLTTGLSRKIWQKITMLGSSGKE